MAVRIGRLTDRSAVLTAIETFDRLGRDEFLVNYRYPPGRSYFVEFESRRYDSKAIAGVAYGVQHPDQPTPTAADFSGGERTAVLALRRLGFTVVTASPQPAEEVSREAVTAAMDEWDVLGREEFLRQHDLAPALRYLIERDDRRYDAKAIVTLAYRREHPDELPLRSGDFRGDRVSIRMPLERLGFSVIDAAPGSIARAQSLAPDDRTHPRPLTTPYRHVDPTKGAEPKDPFQVDPNEVDRGLRGHAETQERLADLVIAYGLELHSPGPGDPDFDIAWRDHDGTVVAEVKSLTAANEARQLRLGLGQILDYQDWLQRSGESVRPVLAVERRPTDPRWESICKRHGVTLAWPETFPRLFAQSQPA